MSVYTPTTFTKGTATKISESWVEHYRLLWDGWTPSGGGITVDDANKLATHGYVQGILDAMAESLTAMITDGIGEIDDAAIAAHVASAISNTRSALTYRFTSGIRVNANDPDYSGLNDAALNAAFAKANTFGVPVIIPTGTTVTLTGRVDMPDKSHLILAPGSVIRHTGNTTALRAAGTEGAVHPLTVNAAIGATVITAPGHGLAAGDWFRLGSDKIYDSQAVPSTNSTLGEILQVASVSGDIITPVAPVVGGPYNITDSAFVTKMTMVSDVVIEGTGTIIGNKVPNSNQIGIQFQNALRCHVIGVNTRDIDQRHIFFRDALRCSVQGGSSDWAQHDTHAYAISVSDASADCWVENYTSRFTRHAFTTNNSTSGHGIVRRIRVSNSVSLSTSKSYTTNVGGDAWDTHTAAEDIIFDGLWSFGASGQGYNIECASATVINCVSSRSATNGFGFHNESDQQGRYTIRNNECRSYIAGVAFSVTNGIRGTTATYDKMDWSNNRPPQGASSNSITFTPTMTDTAPGFQLVTLDNNTAGTVWVRPDTTTLVVSNLGAASAGNLSLILGGRRGQRISVRSSSNSQAVTVKTGSPNNIRTQKIGGAPAADFVLTPSTTSMVLERDATNWNEISRATF